MEENIQPKEKTKVRNKKKKGIIVLLLLTILVIAIVGIVAYARYSSKINGQGTVQVANWSFKVNGTSTETISIDMTETMSNTNGKVEDKKIAPGTSGAFILEIDASGSEVAVDYNIKMVVTEMPTNLKLYRDVGHTDIIQKTAENMVNIDGYIDLANINEKVLCTIYWDWPYETGQTESEKKANDAIDTRESSKTCNIPITVTGKQADPNKVEIKIGDTVNYTTSLNEVELNNWKVFYQEGDYIYLILGDYLPNSAVNISNISKIGSYGVYSNSRTNLLNAVTTKSNWNSLLKGSIDEKNIDYTNTTDSNIYANGTPTLELYVKSWNEEYPSNKLYTAQNSTGYYVGTSANPTSTIINMSGTTGYSNTLYYPHTSVWNLTPKYYLASPSANSSDGIMFVEYGGSVGYNGYNEINMAFRPIVCLPSSVLD